MSSSVLVVDDDVNLGRAVQRVLSGAGYSVIVATDGGAALEAIKRESFDVIVSDIQMPGLSGVEVLRGVRANDLDVPVILMTGNPTLETAMAAISLGALQYLRKPVPNDVLIETVRRASMLHRMAQLKRDALRLAGGEDALAGDRAGLQAGFDRALETMWIAFQPIVDASGRTLFGYEALMRSREPSLPHPGAILEAAERLDLVHRLGRRVRELAAHSFAGARSDAVLFVNLHPHDLLDIELFESKAPLGLLAERVVLEITERSTIDDIKDIQSRVALLRGRGFRIAIDDLGAGYAGLSSFAALQPEIVKLDMSLVRDVHKSEVRRRLMESMTSLCKEMKMLVVAEGIETAEERDCVLGCGCQLLQGYFFAKPGPPFPAVEGVA
ncbi:MAG TPA: EAL domain-containing protein [Polyangiaceae bacterium]|jgi:EAL domain-containing protein (putative c-di-GMP-specific phosphodiesterase class I)